MTVAGERDTISVLAALPIEYETYMLCVVDELILDADEVLVQKQCGRDHPG